MDVIIVGPWMLTIELQMLRRTDFGLGNGEVWMDVILVFGPWTLCRTGWDNVTVDPWMLWGKDKAWVG